MSEFPVRLSFPVHWGEMDALGHVNNTRYFVWFESARMALFERVGLSSIGEPEVGPILAHTHCDFRRPVRYPARVSVETRVSSLGRTSFVMDYRVLQAEGGEEGGEAVVAEGRGVVVLINYSSGEKVPIPQALRDRFEALGGAEGERAT